MVEQIPPNALAAWFAAAPAGSAPVVLDVREPWEVARASVVPDGFTLRTLPMAGVPTGLATLAPDQSIACLCHHGARSQQVAMFLERQGFARVANIAGGIDAWSLQCDPTVPRY
jgi:rhodanese-related sulfurtransferase